MKTNIHWNGKWVYTEICDRCGRPSEWECTDIPNIEKPDFCINCMSYFIERGISYRKAKGAHKVP